MSGPSPRVRGNQHHARAAHQAFRSIPACAGQPLLTGSGGIGAPVHPRVCGATQTATGAEWLDAGPSPRVRGNRLTLPSPADPDRSIPACAGQPHQAVSEQRRHQVHPRVCGATRSMAAASAWSAGPSPRVRGNPLGDGVAPAQFGSIPACAGQPKVRCLQPAGAGVHPRVCGATAPGPMLGSMVAGPSPRVRGNRAESAHKTARERSIPACAGQPMEPSIGPGASRVHPRVCGATIKAGLAENWAGGPSPRVRGNPLDQHRRRRRDRSIPACAGQPERRRCQRCHRRVHPRVCGATFTTGGRGGTRSGPSPRVRGNRLDEAENVGAFGSIPACAGQPRGRQRGPSVGTVHPRVCGATLSAQFDRQKRGGPSPRVRGNPKQAHKIGPFGRSIPACAGQPGARSVGRRLRGVHPRVCGATKARAERPQGFGGPSPRVRGNHVLGEGRGLEAGSIPACAGQPVAARSSATASAVHPRVCGATIFGLGFVSPARGPSPRVRGNLGRQRAGWRADRSIPACAGQPYLRSIRCDFYLVHPRVCGATFMRSGSRRSAAGPSPRVRGNHELRAALTARKGSIPACAGQPCWTRSLRSASRVHPRVCGATDHATL